MKVNFIKSSALFIFILMSSISLAENVLPVLRVKYDNSLLNRDTYIAGTVQLEDVDGTVVEFNTQFRQRGATASNYTMKPSLNMKIRDAEDKELDVNLLGLREASSFILDAMAIDRINMRNRVAFDIWNAFSLLPYETQFSSRNGTVGKFVEMYINDEYKGIYCLSDKINRKLLGLKKPKTDDAGNLESIRGVLYKHGTSDISDQNTPGFYNDYMVYVPRSKDAWELHEPDDYPCQEAWTPLVDLYDSDNYKDYSYVKEHFYLQNLADYTIFVAALSIGDNWGNKNKFFSVYNIKGSGDETKFIITPWDLDTSLGGSYDGGKYDGNYTNWKVTDVIKNSPLPIAAAKSQEEFKNMLVNTWMRARCGALAIDSVKNRMQDYANLFISSGAWQRSLDYWQTQKYSEKIVEDLQREIDLIGKWYEARFKEMDEYFGIDDSATAIENITPSTKDIDDISSDDIIYNLQGIRIYRITDSGLYIINGTKVFVQL